MAILVEARRPATAPPTSVPGGDRPGPPPRALSLLCSRAGSLRRYHRDLVSRNRSMPGTQGRPSDRSGGTGAHPADGPGEAPVGLPADQGRAAELGNMVSATTITTLLPRAGLAPPGDRPDLETVPASPG